MNILDNDFSRILTSYIAYLHYRNAKACYRLISRKYCPLEPTLAPLIDKRLNHLKESILNGMERLVSTKFPQISFDPNYVHQLKIDMAITRIDVWWDKTIELSIQGPFSSASLLSTPIQTILNELILEALTIEDITQIRKRVTAGVLSLDKADPSRSGIFFSELGTRRRINIEHQLDTILNIFQLFPERLIGTGNPYISEQIGLPLLGMMHHDYILAATAGHINGMRIAAERQAILQWQDTFGSFYDTALSDTFGLEHFLAAFDYDIADSIHGVRHDSGDPVNWARRMKKHYNNKGIMSMKKKFVFTDSLDWGNLPVIFNEVQTICRPLFGLGRNFTGAGSRCLTDMSIKLIKFDHHHVRKLSDDNCKRQPEYLSPIPVKNLLTIL